MWVMIMLTQYLTSSTNGDQLAKALSPTPSGWSATSFCQWKGIRCTTNRLTSINIASQSLSGTLPPDLNSLSQLTSLSRATRSHCQPLHAGNRVLRGQQLHLHSPRLLRGSHWLTESRHDRQFQPRSMGDSHRIDLVL
ncbi:hypothetical protein VIGAN_04431100 [Vigna angularis var. angularis]|uniref:Leucine-rich repeat-containing N-terminal plant-type domain-containing protein n=1 Tax=Vigna angularis var. angularis TaxID=157739 RepID=A0A0S3S1B7_PHAAN|nr:hypothetical protein VIGAN_04431100 [Vigna angularis var. angularis]